MKPELLALADVADALSTPLAEVDVTWRLVVIDGRREGAPDELSRALERSCGVLVLAPDDAGVVDALERGATDPMRWPATVEHVITRVRRVARLARLPWLERNVQLADDSIELSDTEAVLLDVNPGFERVTGYAREQVLGRTPASLFRIETVDPSYYRQIGVGLSTVGLWRGQLAARRGDRSISFQEATIALVPDPTGRIVGHLAVKRDTSRDNLAASALAGAEARTRAMLDSAAEALILHSPDGRIAEANPAASRMLGMTRQELLATTADAFETAPADEIRASWSASGDEPCIREGHWRRSDGTTFPVEVSAGRVELVGNPFVFVVARDITERRQAEEALRALAEIVDTVTDGLLAVDADGLVTRANPALGRMLSVRPTPGEPAQGLHAAFGPLVRDVMKAREDRTIDLALPGNRMGSASASAVLADGEDRAVGCVVLVRDVTLARQVDRLKTDFITTVSHELRTPLTSVLGFARLARSRLDAVLPHVPEAEKKARKAAVQAAEQLDVIAAEGTRLATLIDDLLDISKMEAGRVDWRRDDLAVADLVTWAVEASRGMLVDPGVQVRSEVEEPLPAVRGDGPRLQQVLQHLVSNAAKFTAHGTITIGARRVDQGVEVSVTDTGQGIPAADHAAIFEPFRQSSSDTLTDKPRGTGLGLAIARHIVERHGGRIGVESAPGQGSRFAFVLPV